MVCGNRSLLRESECVLLMRIDLDKWVCGLIYLWVYNGTGFVDYGFDFVVLVWWEEGGDGR